MDRIAIARAVCQTALPLLAERVAMAIRQPSDEEMMSAYDNLYDKKYHTYEYHIVSSPHIMAAAMYLADRNSLTARANAPGARVSVSFTPGDLVDTHDYQLKMVNFPGVPWWMINKRLKNEKFTAEKREQLIAKIRATNSYRETRELAEKIVAFKKTLYKKSPYSRHSSLEIQFADELPLFTRSVHVERYGSLFAVGEVVGFQKMKHFLNNLIWSVMSRNNPFQEDSIWRMDVQPWFMTESYTRYNTHPEPMLHFQMLVRYPQIILDPDEGILQSSRLGWLNTCNDHATFRIGGDTMYRVGRHVMIEALHLAKEAGK